MALVEYIAQAPVVAQVDTITVGGTINGETFEIKIDGKVMATFTDTAHTIASVVAGLVAAWNNSSHPYAAGIIAADSSPTLTLTATVPGCPFEITLNTPGGSATFSRSTTTANSCPEDASVVTNYSSGSLPGSTDTLVFKNGAVNICWGLEAITDLNKFEHHASWTGRFGLDYTSFAQSRDGVTTLAGYREYRKVYFKTTLGGTEPKADIGIGDGAGSDRMMLHFLGSPTLNIWKSSLSSADLDRPAIRLLTQNVSSTAVINLQRNCFGGVGVGAEKPDEACKVNAFTIAEGITSPVIIGGNTDVGIMKFQGGNIRCFIHDQVTDAALIENATVEFLGDQFEVSSMELLASAAVLVRGRLITGDALTIRSRASIDFRPALGECVYTTITIEDGIIYGGNDVISWTNMVIQDLSKQFKLDVTPL